MAMHGALTHDTRMTCCHASHTSHGHHKQQTGMHAGNIVPGVLVRC